jgi:hypothetical protein
MQARDRMHTASSGFCGEERALALRPSLNFRFHGGSCAPPY